MYCYSNHDIVMRIGSIFGEMSEQQLRVGCSRRAAAAKQAMGDGSSSRLSPARPTRVGASPRQKARPSPRPAGGAFMTLMRQWSKSRRRRKKPLAIEDDSPK
jgi:hypothetical protein